MSTGEPDRDQEERHSSFRLEIAFSVGYNRHRAAAEGKWEGRFITLVLLVAGVPATIWVIYEIVSRVTNG